MHLLQFPLCQKSVTTGSATSSSCTGTEKVLQSLKTKVKTGPYVCIIPQGYQQTCYHFLPTFFAQLFYLRHSPFPLLSIFCFLYWQTTIELWGTLQDWWLRRPFGWALPGYSQQQRLTPHAFHPFSNTAIYFAYKIFLHSTAAKLSAMLITFPKK
jgi:hypothetical protein